MEMGMFSESTTEVSLHQCLLASFFPLAAPDHQSGDIANHIVPGDEEQCPLLLPLVGMISSGQVARGIYRRAGWVDGIC
jgi:hypothetical protein